MEYDENLVEPKRPTMDFFNENALEIVGYMDIQPKAKTLPREELLRIRKEAKDFVAENHEFGPYRNLCNTCYDDIAECDGDPMYGKLSYNVCYCKQYKGDISPEDVAKGKGTPS